MIDILKNMLVSYLKEDHCFSEDFYKLRNIVKNKQDFKFTLLNKKFLYETNFNTFIDELVQSLA